MIAATRTAQLTLGNALYTFSKFSAERWTIGVSKKPGSMMDTFTPQSRNSRRKHSEYASKLQQRRGTNKLESVSSNSAATELRTRTWNSNRHLGRRSL